MLENEFSTVSIDSSLVNDGGKGTVKGFSGNCLCCLSGNPVLDALYQFTVYPEKESQFLAVLLELSGAADPLTVVQDLQPNVGRGILFGWFWYGRGVLGKREGLLESVGVVLVPVLGSENLRETGTLGSVDFFVVREYKNTRAWFGLRKGYLPE